MATDHPKVMVDDNLSYAWARALLASLEPRGTAEPMVVSIRGFAARLPAEDREIRQAIDSKLSQLGLFCCKTTASLIFPEGARLPRAELSCAEFGDWYMRCLYPRLRRRGQGRNSRGTYFGRLVSYPTGREPGGINQLAKIIDLWHGKRSGRPRRSAMQAAIVHPESDLTRAALSGFPCLQQVGFAWDGDGGLVLNAFYPTEYIFDRGYGNYLGLCWLGAYMAENLGIRFSALTCFIGVPHPGSKSKAELSGLSRLLGGRLRQRRLAEGATQE